jgi:cytochrome c oxidase assembly protein subunit 15
MSQKRSIFEEVSETTRPQTQTAQPGAIGRPRGARKGIRAWLILLFVMVFAMILIGGLTRLTDSGLSITEWKPVTGAIPPLSAEAWQNEFAKYQQIPEYQLQNAGMSLSEFKSIYWWEWGHRQLGRTIGLIWALGFFGFLVARKIPVGWTPRLLGCRARLAGGWFPRACRARCLTSPLTASRSILALPLSSLGSSLGSCWRCRARRPI